MDWSSVKELSIPEGIVKAVYHNGAVIWLRPSAVTYLPILPDDTEKHPMYLRGYVARVYDSSTGGTSAAMSDAPTGYTTIRNVAGIINKTWSALVLPWFSTHFATKCDNTLYNDPNTMTFGQATTLMRHYTCVDNETIGAADGDSTSKKLTLFKSWLDAQKASGTPVTVLVPDSDDDSLWFAATDGTAVGYYCPETGAFFVPHGMTGTVIQRVEYVEGDNDAYCKTNYHLRGDDTLKIKFKVGSNASNIGGCFVSSSASDNFCLYAGVGAKWYMRYDGGNNRNYTVTTDWQELVASPTGAVVNGSRVETWTQASFTSSNPMYIGYLYNSTSPKIRGKLAWFEVAGKHKYLPVKVGSVYRMMDVLCWVMAEQVNTWSGGAVIAEAIPFPESIPVSNALTMGGSPNNGEE